MAAAGRRRAPPEILQSAGLPVRQELRGVGENYRDHYAPRMKWRVTSPITLNEQTRGVARVKEIVKYYAQRRGVLSFAAGIAYGFVRTGPELAVPDIQYVFAHASYSDPQVRVLDRAPGMTVSLYQCRPESTGSIYARSPDPFAAPAIRRRHEDRPPHRQLRRPRPLPRLRDEPGREAPDR